jgi:hypothetical protein
MAETAVCLTISIGTEDLAELGGRNIYRSDDRIYADFDDGHRERILIVGPHPAGAVLDLCRYDHCDGRYIICACKIVPADQIVAAAAELLDAHLPDWQPRR